MNALTKYSDEHINAYIDDELDSEERARLIFDEQNDAELAARIRALLRRDGQRGSVIEVGDLRVEVTSGRAERSGVALDLTSREFAVLHYLAAHAGEIVSAEQLLEHCWDAHADEFSSSVKVILSRVRAKLGPPSLITTIRGAGYRLDAA